MNKKQQKIAITIVVVAGCLYIFYAAAMHYVGMETTYQNASGAAVETAIQSQQAAVDSISNYLQNNPK